MEELKQTIIKYFKFKGNNFQKGLKESFKKKQPNTSSERIYIYRDILIYEIFKKLSEKQDDIFDDIKNPLNYIETTLFEYLNSEV
jgi:hypothetical protein